MALLLLDLKLLLSLSHRPVEEQVKLQLPLVLEQKITLIPGQMAQQMV